MTAQDRSAACKHGSVGLTCPRCAATEQRMIEFTADISLRTTTEDAEVYQAVQDAIGHTGAKVIEITFIEGAVDADHA